jgi:deoxycytidylate deaminase
MTTQAAAWAPQLREAYALALDSPGPSTQNAAITFGAFGVEIGSGVNTFTHGMEVTDDLLERPKKYTFIEHAERNALFDTLKNRGGRPHTMVAPWAACADCARAIVQSGVKFLVRHVRDDETGRWGQSIEDGDTILRAGGVDIIEFHGPLGECAPILFAGKMWTP